MEIGEPLVPREEDIVMPVHLPATMANPLERKLRDSHGAASHRWVSAPLYETLGGILFGKEPDPEFAGLGGTAVCQHHHRRMAVATPTSNAVAPGQISCSYPPPLSSGRRAVPSRYKTL